MTPLKPETDNGYLEAVARIIFMGGLNRKVVDSKWLGFREVFSNFEISKVATLTPEDIDLIASDDRIIKYRAKLAAVVSNARKMIDIASENNSFGIYVNKLFTEKGIVGASSALAEEFSYVSKQGAIHWLYSTGYDIGVVTEKMEYKYAPFDG